MFFVDDRNRNRDMYVGVKGLPVGYDRRYGKGYTDGYRGVERRYKNEAYLHGYANGKRDAALDTDGE